MLLIAREQKLNKRLLDLFGRPVDSKIGKKIEIELQIGQNYKFGDDNMETYGLGKNILHGFFRIAFNPSVLIDTKFTFRYLNEKTREIKGSAKLSSVKEIQSKLHEIWNTYYKQYRQLVKEEQTEMRNREKEIKKEKIKEAKAKAKQSGVKYVPPSFRVGENNHNEITAYLERHKSKYPQFNEYKIITITTTFDVETLKKSILWSTIGITNNCCGFNPSMPLDSDTYKALQKLGKIYSSYRKYSEYHLKC